MQTRQGQLGIDMHVAGSRNAPAVAVDVRAHEDVENHPGEIVLHLSHHEDFQQSSAEMVEEPQSSAETVDQPPSSENVQQPSRDSESSVEYILAEVSSSIPCPICIWIRSTYLRAVWIIICML